MREITEKDIDVIYRDDGLLLGEYGGKMYLIKDKRSYMLTDYPFGRCLYIKSSDGGMMTVRLCFTVYDLRRAARTGCSVKMITGSEYDIRGMCRLILKAIELSAKSVDIGYLEGHCFIDYMKQRNAVSPETAVDRAEAGIDDPNVMSCFISSNVVEQMNNGLYYLLGPGEKSSRNVSDSKDRPFRLISNQVRFGCGYRTLSGARQYYAWHGYPDRNSDYITYAEITESEYEQIGMEYPRQIDADRETAEQFRRKYVDGHPVIKEGWDVSL